MKSAFSGGINPQHNPLQRRSVWILLLLMLAFATRAYGHASDTQNTGLPWVSMLIELTGGLALFLFGLDLLADALKKLAGDKLRVLLAKLTQTPVRAALTGTMVTAILQSSSVTTVLVVGFISANLMSLSQSVGVIMGANIGTTITAQIIAFKVTQFALPMVTIGVATRFISDNENVVRYANIVLGLGLLFFGMALMSEGMAPLRYSESFKALLIQWQNPLLAIVYSAIFTALVQSSSATTGIVIAMATQGLLSLEAGIALLLGANIGTCFTAMLASIGKPREAVRAAVVHVMFNTIGVLLWVGAIGLLAELVVWISPVSNAAIPELRLAEEVPRQVANAHTLFNIANTLLLLPFAGLLAKAAERLVPTDKTTEPRGRKLKPRYLSDILLDTPALAFEAVEKEMFRMGRRVSYMLRHFVSTLDVEDQERVAKIRRMDDEVDALHREIIGYLGELSKYSLSQADTKRLVGLMEAANTIEDIGDIVELNLVHLGLVKQRKQLTFSPSSIAMVEDIHADVCEDFDALLSVISDHDSALANDILSHKKPIKDKVRNAYNHLVARLVADEPHRMSTYRLEIDLVEKLKHIHDGMRRIARTLVRRNGEMERGSPHK